jgi:hypothetical protein
MTKLIRLILLLLSPKKGKKRSKGGLTNKKYRR